MKPRPRHILPLLALLLALLPDLAHAWEYDVKAQLDRTRVPVGQSFTLVVEVSGEDANRADEPQLADLANAGIEIVGRRESSNFSMQLINGKLQSNRTKTYTYTLIASKTGTRTIPPITVKLAGERRMTDPIRFEVVAGRAVPHVQTPTTEDTVTTDAGGEDVFVRASLSPQKVYQGQQMHLSYDLWHRRSIGNLSFRNIPDLSGFLIEDNSPNQLQTRPRMAAGRQYQVGPVRDYILFPLDDGTIEIGPLDLEAQVRTDSGRNSRDPFGLGMFRGRYETRVLRSRGLSVEVLPLPAEGRPAGFSGAVGTVRVRMQSPTASLNAGDSLTLTVIVETTASPDSIGAPQLDLPASVETYPPETDKSTTVNNGQLYTRQTWRYVLVPREAGRLTLPAIEVPYFDPQSETYRVARSNQLTVQVAPGAPQEQGLPSVGGGRGETVSILGHDIRAIKGDRDALRKPAAPPASSLWFWLVNLLPVLALMGVIGHQLRNDRQVGRADQIRRSRAHRKALKALNALGEGDEAGIASALLDYLADRTGEGVRAMTRDELAGLLAARGHDEATVQELCALLDACDMSRFGGGAGAGELDTRAREWLQTAERSW